MRAHEALHLDDLLSERYLSKWNDTAPRPLFEGTATTFVHLPKTAGVAFTRTVGERFENYFVVPWEDLDGGVDKVLSQSRDYDIVLGHLTHDHVRCFLEHEDPFAFASFLREPVDRAISDYWYCRSSVHSNYERFREAFPTLEKFVEWGGMSTNLQVQRLVGDVTSVQECIDRVMETYHFVGLTEMFEASCLLFGAAWGIGFAPPATKHNATVPDKDPSESTDQSLLDRLAETNELDLALHEHVRGLYSEQMENLVALALRAGDGRCS